jgi:hypothetical protein
VAGRSPRPGSPRRSSCVTGCTADRDVDAGIPVRGRDPGDARTGTIPRAPGGACGGVARYCTSSKILNIGMYIEMTTMPTITPTPIIMSGSMIEVSDFSIVATSSS